jgi:hypothetical protein
MAVAGEIGREDPETTLCKPTLVLTPIGGAPANPVEHHHGMTVARDRTVDLDVVAGQRDSQGVDLHIRHRWWMLICPTVYSAGLSRVDEWAGTRRV